MIVYISGPYETGGGSVEENIQHARQVAQDLWRRGHAVICPHCNTAAMENAMPPICRERFLTGDLALMAAAEAVVMLDGWQGSEGAREEHARAVELGIPLFAEDDPVPLHSVEAARPVQVQAFRERLGAMMRVHLAKNQDYSSASILGMGELGVLVRAWDKLTRLLSLYGVQIRVEHLGMEQPRPAAHEAIEDSWLDLANYAVIGAMVRAGEWGE